MEEAVKEGKAGTTEAYTLDGVMERPGQRRRQRMD